MEHGTRCDRDNTLSSPYFSVLGRPGTPGTRPAPAALTQKRAGKREAPEGILVLFTLMVRRNSISEGSALVGVLSSTKIKYENLKNAYRPRVLSESTCTQYLKLGSCAVRFPLG